MAGEYQDTWGDYSYTPQLEPAMTSAIPTFDNYSLTGSPATRQDMTINGTDYSNFKPNDWATFNGSPSPSGPQSDSGKSVGKLLSQGTAPASSALYPPLEYLREKMWMEEARQDRTKFGMEDPRATRTLNEGREDELYRRRQNANVDNLVFQASLGGGRGPGTRGTAGSSSGVQEGGTAPNRTFFEKQLELLSRYAPSVAPSYTTPTRREVYANSDLSGVSTLRNQANNAMTKLTNLPPAARRAVMSSLFPSLASGLSTYMTSALNSGYTRAAADKQAQYGSDTNAYNAAEQDKANRLKVSMSALPYGIYDLNG